jgi:hypothetical protein
MRVGCRYAEPGVLQPDQANVRKHSALQGRKLGRWPGGPPFLAWRRSWELTFEQEEVRL